MRSRPAVTLSSNTLFHFTDSLDHLLSILTHEFRPRFSKEALPIKEDTFVAGIPMVCFCDIPLSQTRAHMSVYGSYAIGLTKRWGINHGISPVIYGNAGSPVTESFHILIKRGLGLRTSQRKEGRIDRELWDEVFRLSCFVKPYEGPFERRRRRFPKVRFYDEREWRWVPDIRAGLFPWGIDEEDCDDPVAFARANEQMWHDHRLSFNPRDIRYLIVARERELGGMIERIDQIKARFGDAERRLLATRLTSAQQIAADF